MFCEEMGLLLSKYVDDELVGFERKKVEDHIIVCSDCRDTLAMFLRNENIIASAFSGETFGEKVADDVLDRIKGKESRLAKILTSTLVLATKLKQKVSMPVAIPIAASAIFAVVFLGLIWSLQNKVDTLNGAILRQKELMNVIAKAPSEVSNKDVIFANIGKDQFEIRGTFLNQKANIASFNLERKALGVNETPVTIATELKEARFRDTTSVAGKSYEYKFVAMSSDGTTQTSLPIYVTIKPDEWSNISDYIEIKFLKAEEDSILISVSQTSDGVTFSELFIAKKGDEIGTEVYSAEAQRKIDFSTGLKLENIEDDDDSIIVTVASNKIDAKTGLPVYNSQTGKPETEYQPLLFTRLNKKATLINNKGEKHSIFQDRSIKIPLVR